jgi:hypothetical protein
MYYSGSFNLSLLIEILASYPYDLNGCLANCTNNGRCVINSKERLVCVCNQNFAGSSCDLNIKACSKNPCLNYGECIEMSNSSYKCDCKQNFFGANCESKIDLCLNETCSGHGVCFDNSSAASCKCFDNYDGNKCELESNYLKMLIKVIKISTIIAIVIICLFYGIFLLMDLHTKFFMRKKKLNRRKKAKKPRNKKLKK